MNDYTQTTPYWSHRIDNQMFINDKGEHMTRRWNGNVMDEIPTDPGAIRTQVKSHLWKPGDDDLN